MKDPQPTTADDVRAICEERSIRFIRFWFTDILGQLKSFSIGKDALDDAFEGGMGFDGSSITCLLYTSDAADDLLCVDLGGRRIIKKKNTSHK